ncbi:uncharacterized protein BYT42DRAFT_558097 [Radiomyces spectabilis]|uniref:uncharacterized protein n=1 Tax=Radiomyces spectabilis TaxID=64574 RepID=UPI00221E4B13|nr:uncharacterized protein BYT42DRAFT_558097 [Radiomyces spectabilis]KAI8391793.1 hypothetical protein BYT42DRAFT_558097 [Radiomyces spectabilis]
MSSKNATDIISLHANVDGNISTSTTTALAIVNLPGKGRGYVATQPIKAGSIVHTAVPLATTVSQEWMPETCMWCFAFSYPKRLRVKAVSEDDTKQLCHQWSTRSRRKHTKAAKTFHLKDALFCSEECKQQWKEAGYPGEWELVVASFSRLDKEFKRRVDVDEDTPMDGHPFLKKEILPLVHGECDWIDLNDDSALQIWIDDAWTCATEHPDILFQQTISDMDRTMCRLIAACLARRQCEQAYLFHNNTLPSFEDLQVVQDNELAHFRLHYPSDGTGLVRRRSAQSLDHIPVEVLQIMHLYLFFAEAMAATGTEPSLNHSQQLFRFIYFREMSNSFGLWERPDSDAVTDDQELLGWGIYTSAVYFNHSCDANVIKRRQGRTMQFVAKRDIAQGEEACISYGSVEDSLKGRRKRLWENYHFKCACVRCLQEEEAQYQTKSIESS